MLMIFCTILLFLLSGCGDGCYQDPSIVEGADGTFQTIYVNKSINRDLDPKQKAWTRVLTSVTANTNPIKLDISGRVYLCDKYNSNYEPEIDPITKEVKTDPVTGEVKIKMHGYNVVANAPGPTPWVTLDTNVYGDDEIVFKIDKPDFGSGVSYPASDSSPLPGASLNAWSYTNKLEKAEHCKNRYGIIDVECLKNCKNLSSIPLKGGSVDSKCPILYQPPDGVRRYYTCPGLPCDPDALDPSVLMKCRGQQLDCWFVGGAGLQLKFTNDSCDSQGGEIFWFRTNRESDFANFGQIIFPTAEDRDWETGPNCHGARVCENDKCTYDVDKALTCTNVNTYRSVKLSKYYKNICARLPDENGSDNIGGYILQVARQSCIADNGVVSKAADGETASGARLHSKLGAIEYIISPDTPREEDRGTPIDKTPQTGEIVLNNDQNQTGDLYLRVIDNLDGYEDNRGNYKLKISYRYPTLPVQISCAIEHLKEIIRDITIGSMPAYFNNLTCPGGGHCMTSPYVKYIRYLLILYIMVYGLMFIMGYTEIKQKDLIIRILKIGVVTALISDGSWDFFHKYFFNAFICGMDDLIRIATIQNTPDGNVFGFVDKILALMLINTTFLKILAMAVISPLGFILAIILLLSILIFLEGVFKAVITYLTAILVLALLILLAPIFIPFMLFEQTKHLFENWIQKLIRYSIEPVMLVIGLSVLIELIYVVFIQITNFSVCWRCVWPFNFFSSIFPSGTNPAALLFCLKFFAPVGFGPGGGSSLLGIELVNILFFLILAKLIREYDKLVTGIMGKIIDSKPQDTYNDPGSKTGTSSMVGSAVYNRTGIPALEAAARKAIGTRVKSALGMLPKEKKEEDKGAGSEAPREGGIKDAMERKAREHTKPGTGLDHNKMMKSMLADPKFGAKYKDLLGATKEMSEISEVKFASVSKVIRDLKIVPEDKVAEVSKSLNTLYDHMRNPENKHAKEWFEMLSQGKDISVKSFEDLSGNPVIRDTLLKADKVEQLEKVIRPVLKAMREAP